MLADQSTRIEPPAGGRAITPLSDDRDDDGLEMPDIPPSAKDVADVELFVLNRGARVLVMDVADLMGLRRATVMRCIAASTRIKIKREYKRVYVVAVGG